MELNAAILRNASRKRRICRARSNAATHLSFQKSANLLYVSFLYLNFLNLNHAFASAESQNTYGYNGYYSGYALDALPVISIDDNAPYDLDVVSNASSPSSWNKLDCLTNQNSLGFADRARFGESSKLRWINQKLWNVTWFAFQSFDAASGTLVHNSQHTRVNEDGSLSIHVDLINPADATNDTLYFECVLEYIGHRRQSLEKIMKSQFPASTLNMKANERQTGWLTMAKELPRQNYSRSSCINAQGRRYKCPKTRKKIIWRSRRARYRIRRPRSPPKIKCYNDMKRKHDSKDELVVLPQLKECEEIYEESAFVLDCSIEGQNYQSDEAIWFMNGTRLEKQKFGFKPATLENGIDALEIFLVNGRLHINRAIYNSTDFTCQLLGLESIPFTPVLLPFSFDSGEVPPNAPTDCFFPGILDAHKHIFTTESESLTAFVVHRIEAGNAFNFEVICQPVALTEENAQVYFWANREIFLNESLHQQLYDPCIAPSAPSGSEKISYRTIYDQENGKSRTSRIRHLLSPIFHDLDLRSLKADNEIMFRENIFASSKDRSIDFNLGMRINYFGQQVNFDYNALVQILTLPDVLMQYRTVKEMLQFEIDGFSSKMDRSNWSKRAEYSLIEEETILTCHVQGQNIENWRFEWLHDGKPIRNREFRTVLRKARKITDNRGTNDVDKARQLCFVFNKGDQRGIDECLEEQKLFGYLPDEAVEILPEFDPELGSDGVSTSFTDICREYTNSEKNETCIQMKYKYLKHRYARMDLYIPPNKARGSFQCRVTSDLEAEGSVIKTFVFFDAYDSYYTPAALSLVHDWRPRPSFGAPSVFSAKFSDIFTHVQPMKLVCQLYGIDEADVRRFDYTEHHAGVRGDMTRTKGHWPSLLWKQNGERFQPGEGNKLYRHQDESYIFQADTLGDPTGRFGRWNPDQIWETDESMAHLAKRIKNTDKATIMSELLIYDFSHGDEGSYSCEFDLAKARLKTPNAMNRGKMESFALVIESVEPSNTQLKEKVGVKITWSVPFDVCDGQRADDCNENIMVRKEHRQAAKEASFFWESFDRSETRFAIMLYPRRRFQNAAFTPPEGQNPTLQVDIASKTGENDPIYERVLDPENTLLGHHDCDLDNIRCFVDPKFIWSECEELGDILERLECDRYRRALRTRIVCSCTFRDPSNLNERDFGRRGRFEYGVDYEVQVRMKTGKFSQSTGFDFSEYLVAHNRPIVRVPVPKDSDDFDHFSPARINREESNVLIDGIARIRWDYTFEHPESFFNKQKFQPMISSQTLVWGTLSQHLKVRQILSPELRIVDIGPFSPWENFTYVVHLETTFVSDPPVTKKSQNFFVNSDNLNRFDRCQDSRRGAPVRDLWSSLDSDFSSLTVNYRFPTLNRNEYANVEVFTTNFTQLAQVNPGRIETETDRTSLRVCDVFYSPKPLALEMSLQKPMSRSFAVAMDIYDFKKIKSQPAHNILINEKEGLFAANILPKCDILLTTPNEEPSDLQELTWICPNHTNIAFFDNSEHQKQRILASSKSRKRSSAWKPTDELSFIQQLKNLDYLQYLLFELRWSFKSEHGDWKYTQIPFEKVVNLDNGKLKNVLGTISDPFKYKWEKPQPPKSAKPTCDKTVVGIRMILRNSQNSGEFITSNFSNEVSFAAQDEDNLTPLSAVVIYHGTNHMIQVLPDTAPQQYCSQETYLQIMVKKVDEKLRDGENNATEWIGCSLLSSDTASNNLISISKMYNKQGIPKTVKEIMANSSDCALYKFKTRKAVKNNKLRPNRQKIDRERCLSPDEFEKSSDWTSWKTMHNSDCAQPTPAPIPPINATSAKKSEQEKEPECDFKFKGSCLNPRIVLAVFIVLVLLIILVLVSIYVCLCKKYFSQRRDQMNDQGTGQYPANQLHDGTITAKPFKDDNCSRQDENLPLMSLPQDSRFATEICPDTPLLGHESPTQLQDSDLEKRESSTFPSRPSTPSEKETSLRLKHSTELVALATSVGESLPSSHNSLSNGESCCSSSSLDEITKIKTNIRLFEPKNETSSSNKNPSSAVQEMYPRILQSSLLGDNADNRHHCPG